MSGSIPNNTRRVPTLFEAMIPLLCMALLLGVGYGIYHFRIEMLLIAASGAAGLVALRLGYTWKEMEDGIMDSIRKGMPAMSIVIVVGIMISSWIASGSIPMLIYYGLQLISPGLFLLTACLVCSVVSVLTGTSYGTAGTVGIAFMGIAQGMGIPPGPAAGAVVAGAYFGDKISPFSDSTNLAAAAAKCNLYDHIPHLLWTTIPAYVLGLVVYGIAGGHVLGDDAGFERIRIIQSTLSGAFVFHWTLLIPPLIILHLSVRKKPPIPGMLLSSLVGLILAVWLQGVSVADAIGVCVTGYKGSTGLADVDRLISRGGMQEMMHVTLIAFCAFAFAGITGKAGMLGVILHSILRFARTTGRLIASTVAASIATAVMTGSSFLSVLVPGELFAPAYKERNLAAKNLSRTTEDSGTVVVPLIPWSIAGVYMSATLAVPTLEYAGWAVMCYTGFLFALVYGFTGFAIAPRKRDDETLPGS
jgi:NhaC family Na+:H+ antiporter